MRSFPALILPVCVSAPNVWPLTPVSATSSTMVSKSKSEFFFHEKGKREEKKEKKGFICVTP